MTTVLVTGATGNIGGHLVAALQGRGVAVRAFVRDPGRAAALDPGVDLAVGDFADPASLEAAMEGVDRVFLTSADGPDKVAHETAVIDAAAAAGVAQVVKLSTIGAAAGSPLPGFDWHGRIEEHLRRSELSQVVLRASFFMSNLLASADAVRNGGRLVAPAGRGRVAMIDPRDVAAVAAAVLAGDGHDRRTYTLTGGQALSWHEAAAALATATGQPVEFVDVPEEAARQGLVEAGLPDWLVAHLIGAFGCIRRGELESTTDTVRALTGRRPRTFADFARDHAPAFAARPAPVAAGPRPGGPPDGGRAPEPGGVGR